MTIVPLVIASSFFSALRSEAGAAETSATASLLEAASSASTLGSGKVAASRPTLSVSLFKSIPLVAAPCSTATAASNASIAPERRGVGSSSTLDPGNDGSLRFDAGFFLTVLPSCRTIGLLLEEAAVAVDSLIRLKDSGLCSKSFTSVPSRSLHVISAGRFAFLAVCPS